MTPVGTTPTTEPSGLLAYYLKHGLNPVHYEMTNKTWHFQRRASLYRTLGIHPATIRNARVLEVAIGTGQNSLYIASLRPRHYTLVEPNPVAIRDIKKLYSQPENRACQPELFEGTLEDFNPTTPYDVVICENWLGRVPAERAMVRKLGTLIMPGGLLAMTTVTPVGFLPNIIRRFLAIRLGVWQLPFEQATARMVDAFGAHLATIAAMTRSAVDWVHDTVLNPHYLTICLPIPTVTEDLGNTFTFVGANPAFAVDWRWFKSLYGEARNFNGHFLDEYYCNCHNFLDYRRVLPRGEREPNTELETAAVRLLETVIDIDQRAQAEHSDGDAAQQVVVACLDDVIAALVSLRLDMRGAIAALREVAQVCALPRVSPSVVRELPTFAGLFGRETVYVSLENAAA
jgi:2-polyprenyl-3-methyl-5-hydroxy-6-metoxy-1,4-benzoquinol methylase